MEGEDRYDELVRNAIINDGETNISVVIHLRNLYSSFLDAKSYPELLSLIKQGKIDQLPKTVLPKPDSIREYLKVYSFMDSRGRKYIATIYDSDELWQDPQIIDIISI